MNRELGTQTQHTGGAGGIVQAELQQCGPTSDIGRLEGKSGELAAYRVIGLYTLTSERAHRFTFGAWRLSNLHLPCLQTTA